MLLKKIRGYISSFTIEQKVFAISLLYSSMLFIIPSNRIFLLVSLFFVIGLYFIWKNLIYSILYAYIFLLPFQNGKGISFLVVPGAYVYGNMPFIMTVNFTMSFILSVFLLYLHYRNKIIGINMYYPKIERADLFLGLFLISNIFASINAQIPWLSFLLSVQIVSYIFIYYVIHQSYIKKWLFTIIAPLFTSLGLLEGLWSILQYVNKGSLGYLNPTPADTIIHSASEDASFFRMQGTFSHPNFLGFFVAFVAPFLFYYSISQYSSYFRKIICVCGFIASMIALILSGSRASWIVLLITFVVLHRSKIVKNAMEIIPVVKQIYISSLLICCITIPFIVIPRLSQLSITFDSNGGAQFRIDLILKSILITTQNPFGIGLGMFPKVLLQEIGGFTSAPTQPHNVVIQILVSSGFIGVISFLGFLYLKIRSIYENTIIRTEEKTIRFVGVVSFCTYLSLSMLYPILTEQQIFAWFWILLSIIV